MSAQRVETEFFRLAQQLEDIPDPTVGPRDYTLSEPAAEPFHPDAPPLGRPRGWAAVAGLAWAATIALPLAAYFARIDVPAWGAWAWLGLAGVAVLALFRALSQRRNWDEGEDGAHV